MIFKRCPPGFRRTLYEEKLMKRTNKTGVMLKLECIRMLNTPAFFASVAIGIGISIWHIADRVWDRYQTLGTIYHGYMIYPNTVFNSCLSGDALGMQRNISFYVCRFWRRFLMLLPLIGKECPDMPVRYSAGYPERSMGLPNIWLYFYLAFWRYAYRWCLTLWVRFCLCR